MRNLGSAACAALFVLSGCVGAAQETPSATRLTTDHYFDLERISAAQISAVGSSTPASKPIAWKTDGIPRCGS